jgi:hypothetical protein
MAEGGAVDTAPGVSAAYRKAMQAGGQQTVNDYYANLRKDAEAYLANPDAPRGVEAYNVLLQSGISTSDLINAGVGQAVLDKIFAVQAPIKQEQFITPAGMTSAYERSPDLAFESQRLTAQGQDHWRGVVVLHDVNNGSFDPMFVSMNFLWRRFGKRWPPKPGWTWPASWAFCRRWAFC